MPIKTRILIISDTHCTPLTMEGHDNLQDEPFRLPMPTVDLLIHCGDLTKTGQLDEYHKALDMLKQIDAPVKLVIAGNHDLSLDADFVQSHKAQSSDHRQPPNMSSEEALNRITCARDLWTTDRARTEGITFLDEGVHHIGLPNGATIRLYASPYTPKFFDWAFPYEHDQDRFNMRQDSFIDARNIAVNPIPTRDMQRIDIVLTHGPAWLRLDYTKRGVPVGCPHLLRALERCRPLIHCFGHIHEGWGAERIRWSDVLSKKTSIDEFESTAWQDGIKSVTKLHINDDLSRQHAAFVDVSSTSESSLQPGLETLFINAAIMNVDNQPTNAPWLVELDLQDS